MCVCVCGWVGGCRLQTLCGCDLQICEQVPRQDASDLYMELRQRGMAGHAVDFGSREWLITTMTT